jgi:predicted ATPase
MLQRYALPDTMPAPLDQITIRGFKSIRDVTLDLPNLSVLIGGNGSGKSNFVQIFGLLNEMVQGNLQTYVRRHGGPEALLHFGQKATESLDLNLHFGANGYQLSLAPSQDDSLFFINETCSFQGEAYSTPFVVDLGGAHVESQLTAEAARHPGRIASHVLASIRSWKVYHFHDTSPTARVKQLGDLDDNGFLREDAANLAAFLLRLKQTAPPQYHQIVAAVRSVAPFFDDFQLRELPRSPEKTRLEWRERGSDSYFNAHSLSDGTLRFICLATLLLQPTLPATVLLDEPELGLHPYAIQVLAALLRAAAQRTQVIVSTQSVTLVNQFEPKDVVIVERHEGASVFRRADEHGVNEWLDDYGLGDLWEKNVLGGRPSA